MSNNPNHHLSIHGHFYQPPRENPWLGVIEDQDSAQPFANWNARINAECYQQLTSSAVTDAKGEISDLFNCYAYLSFNFGPTLLAWLEKNAPETLARLRIADELASRTFNDCGAAMAQGYNHMILPLADSADRDTQIVWGLREFQYRFGRPAASIWLPETAINMATVSALISHGVKYVILSPFQASYVRPFGAPAWTGVPDGTVDTRLPYRLFEVDGAGKTHFDRFLDVFFYDKELSTKVSFSHLLSNAERLEEETYRRFAPDATLPQIVIIATDGEIYGHHEKHGNRALAYFLAHSLRDRKMALTNLTQYLKENPPRCEVRLWEGLDGRGSSWSCAHGVARWESDCGCGRGGNGWNQEWRAPLRRALENLRRTVREVTRRELGGLLTDVREARNDYVAVILHPDAHTRSAFLARHAQRDLTREEQVRLWSLLEAERYSLLMFTSCGWFFDELSGLEPVQNLRYALRAAELCAPWADVDPVTELRNHLASAQSNIPEQGSGQDVFDRHVLSTRYSARAIAAVSVLSRLLGLPEPQYNTRVKLVDDSRAKRGETRFLSGKVRTEDLWTTAVAEEYFCGVIMPDGAAGVLFAADAAGLKKILTLADRALAAKVREEGVPLEALPYADRARFCRAIFGPEYAAAGERLQELCRGITPLLEKLTARRLPLPADLRAVGENALRDEFNRLAGDVAASGAFMPQHRERAEALRAAAARAGLGLATAEAGHRVCAVIEDKISALLDQLSPQTARELLELVRFARTLDVPLGTLDRLRDRFWRVLHLPPTPGTPPELRDALESVGSELAFVWETTDALLDRMLPR